MIFDVGSVLRCRTDAEPDSREPMFFIERTGTVVLLMGAEFQSRRRQRFCEINEPRSPTFPPLGRIDVQTIDVGVAHCEECDDTFAGQTNP